MNFVAVLFHGVNDYGMPEDWPLEVREIATADALPDERPWTVMTRQEYAAHRDAKNTASQEAINAMPDVIQRAKEAKFAEIDAKTARIIEQGFEFPPSSGIRFSLSLEAQTNWLGLQAGRNDPDMAYPVTVNSRRDDTTIDLTNASDVELFCKVATLTKKMALDSGTQLKTAVRAATSVTQINAIVDPR